MAFQARGRDPLFDSNVQAAIEKRSKELVGLALIVLGLMAGAMIASYTPDDPSWLSATDAPVQNWMGRMGASIAAPLFMIVGWGSWGLSLVLFAWGLRLALHKGEERAFSRAVFAPIWIALSAVYAAGQAVGPEWTHSFGLGGLFGDMMLGSLLGIIPLGAGLGLKLAMVLLGIGILAMGAFVLGFTRIELQSIGRFLLVGVVMTYASLLGLMGRSATGAVTAARQMQARQADRRERRRQEAAEAAAWAAAQEAVPQQQPAASSSPVVRRNAPVPPAPEEDEPLFEEDDDTQAWAVAPAPRKGGLLSRMPSLIRRAEPEPMPEPELPEDMAPDHDEVAAPGDDRIRAKIADVVRARRRADPSVATRHEPDPSKPLTKGRGHGPAPLIYQPAPASLRPEPPVTAAQAPAQGGRVEP
ncbi:DNA translocase FtsK 4TM domain-containing protein, partial [Salipiger mucosus]|uniref:DNA translocase FtsK 4TM domain-containing protein n=1 Tax=Salipiger mucosus TaxID=263378 RepID=UPI000562F070